MPHTIATTVYKFDELSDSAKMRAREWWRERPDDFWSEVVIDDAVRMGELLGIEFRQREVKLMGGATCYDPCIWWTGFSCQGDGASFEGTYRYAKGSVKKITAETGGTDEVLIGIAQTLAELQKEYGYQLRALITRGRGGNYSHEYMMDFQVEHPRDIDLQRADGVISECMRSFARWIYKQLEAEYDYQNADEQVDESIVANEYTFTEDGRRFG